MLINFSNTRDVNLGSLGDLSKLIPTNRQGNALNYGQGEGQVQIDNTVWGFYVSNNGNYFMQYEEGVETWSTIQALVKEIEEHLQLQFGNNIHIGNIVGPHT